MFDDEFGKVPLSFDFVNFGTGKYKASGEEKYYGSYLRAAVSSEVPRCSAIGKGILTKGGSAVDAAISTLLCIGIVNNFSSGIGG